jgi:hypothetical protein
LDEDDFQSRSLSQTINFDSAGRVTGDSNARFYRRGQLAKNSSAATSAAEKGTSLKCGKILLSGQVTHKEGRVFIGMYAEHTSL